MLEEVGMTGRFSAEKAKQIKEQRELKAELEAVEEFNDQWGNEQDDDGGDGEEEKERSRRKGKVVEEDDDEPKKRGRLMPRGLIDFGDDDDSE